MNTNKKFILIEVLVFVFPLALALINAVYSSLTRFPWGYNNMNNISVVAILISVAGNIFIYFENNKQTPPSRPWKFISLMLITVLLIVGYIGFSISNFGF